MPRLVKCRATAGCGHEVVKSMPRWQHGYWTRKIGESDCIECKRRIRSQQDALAAYHAGLPRLVGLTERQRQYGETCRAIVLSGLEDLLSDEPLADGGLTVVKPPDTTDAARIFQLLEYLDQKTEAGWWCELYNRYTSTVSGGRREVISFVMTDMRLCCICWQVDEAEQDVPAQKQSGYVCTRCAASTTALEMTG